MTGARGVNKCYICTGFAGLSLFDAISVDNTGDSGLILR